MVDLSTQYLGFKLKNPLVASSSPLSKKLDTIRQMEDKGIAAVVMYSLFEEQITHETLALDYFLNRGTESFPEALTYFPELENYNAGSENYLSLIQKARESTEIPIIASLNGVTSGGWVEMSRKIEQAGANAIELNVYRISTDRKIPAQSLEQETLDLVREIHHQVHIPLSVKLSPFYTALPNFCQHLAQSGANGLSLFNRFYQPDLDIETLEVVPSLQLSTSDDLRLPLRWVAILHNQIQADLALSGGVHTAIDIVKAIMAGANAVLLASELIARGVSRISELLADLEQWLTAYEYASISSMRGAMSQKAVADPSAFERANYMKALTSFDNRIG